MQAIQTKFLGPTDTKGSRIKATCAAGSVTIGYPHELSADTAHWSAAKTLIIKLGWVDVEYGNWFQGGLVNGDTVFVNSGKTVDGVAMYQVV